MPKAKTSLPHAHRRAFLGVGLAGAAAAVLGRSTGAQAAHPERQTADDKALVALLADWRAKASRYDEIEDIGGRLPPGLASESDRLADDLCSIASSAACLHAASFAGLSAKMAVLHGYLGWLYFTGDDSDEELATDAALAQSASRDFVDYFGV